MRIPMTVRKSKTDIINAIAADTGETKASVTKILSCALDTIKNWVAEGTEISLLGFGTFKMGHRAARLGRNPQTGEQIEIKAAKLPKFMAGKAFKEHINKK